MIVYIYVYVGATFSVCLALSFSHCVHKSILYICSSIPSLIEDTGSGFSMSVLLCDISFDSFCLLIPQLRSLILPKVGARNWCSRPLLKLEWRTVTYDLPSRYTQISLPVENFKLSSRYHAWPISAMMVAHLIAPVSGDPTSRNSSLMGQNPV